MNYWESQYCNLNRLCLSFVGLWPFDNTRFAKMRKVIGMFIVVVGIGFQLASLITNECTLEFVLRVLSFTSFSVIYTLKYFAFVLNSKKIKELFRRIQEDWNNLPCEEELEIIKERANAAKLMTKLFILTVYPSLAVFMLGPLIQSTLPAFTSMNITKKVPVSIEFFLDQKKYYFYILAAIDIHVAIGNFVVIGSDTIVTLFAEHACSLFNIACYRIENIYDENIVYGSISQRQYEVYQKVIGAMHIYKRAIEFTQYLTSTFSTSMFFFLVIGTVTSTLNLFRLSRAVTLLDDPSEFVMMGTIMGGTFAYMFCINYTGQEIMNHSSRIFTAIYDTTWYSAPLSTQKALLVVMKRSIKPCVFSMEGIYIPSNEAFAMLCKWSVSFYTFLVSSQN